MAWEWVAPTATAAVGIAGIAFTALTARGGRKHAETLAKQSYEHAERMAREARTQERLADAYVELLAMAERIGQWAQMVRPMMGTSDAPPLPDLADQARVEALAGAFGSAEVRRLVTEWRAIVRRIIQADHYLRLEEADQELGRESRADYGNPWQTIYEVRPKEQAAREALADQVAAELGHRTGNDLGNAGR